MVAEDRMVDQVIYKMVMEVKKDQVAIKEVKMDQVAIKEVKVGKTIKKVQMDQGIQKMDQIVNKNPRIVIQEKKKLKMHHGHFLILDHTFIRSRQKAWNN